MVLERSHLFDVDSKLLLHTKAEEKVPRPNVVVGVIQRAVPVAADSRPSLHLGRGERLASRRHQANDVRERLFLLLRQHECWPPHRRKLAGFFERLPCVRLLGPFAWYHLLRGRILLRHAVDPPREDWLTHTNDPGVVEPLQLWPLDAPADDGFRPVHELLRRVLAVRSALSLGLANAPAACRLWLRDDIITTTRRRLWCGCRAPTRGCTSPRTLLFRRLYALAHLLRDDRKRRFCDPLLE